MSELIFEDGFLCLGAYDVSGVSKTLSGKIVSPVKEWVCFKDPSLGTSGRVSRRRLHGEESASLPIDGYLDFDATWPMARAAFQNKAVHTLTFGVSRAAGGPAWLFNVVQASHEFGAAVAELVPFAGDYQSSGPIAAGRLLYHGDVTVTGSTPGQNLGTVLAGQALYCHFHVPKTPTGTTPVLGAIIESSALGDFSDAVTRYTFSNFTSSGVQRAVVNGPIADATYRVKYTLTGTTPNFRVRIAAGIDSR
jgi:hypothetical protein